MVAIDTSLLSHFLYARNVLYDFRTNQPIDDADRKLEHLLTELDEVGEDVVIPAPTIAEALIAADNISETLAKLRSYARLQIKPFGEKAAVEYAVRVKAAIQKGDKKDGVDADWKTVSFDRQIVTVAAVEGASRIYSTDRDVHRHAELFGLEPCHLNDIVVPAKQMEMLCEDESKRDDQQRASADPPELRGGSDGSPEGEAATEGTEAEEGQGDG
jgi:hypothetical protein